MNLKIGTAITAIIAITIKISISVNPKVFFFSFIGITLFIEWISSFCAVLISRSTLFMGSAQPNCLVSYVKNIFYVNAGKMLDILGVFLVLNSEFPVNSIDTAVYVFTKIQIDTKKSFLVSNFTGIALQ